MKSFGPDKSFGSKRPGPEREHTHKPRLENYALYTSIYSDTPTNHKNINFIFDITLKKKNSMQNFPEIEKIFGKHRVKFVVEKFINQKTRINFFKI